MAVLWSCEESSDRAGSDRPRGSRSFHFILSTVGEINKVNQNEGKWIGKKCDFSALGMIL